VTLARATVAQVCMRSAPTLAVLALGACVAEPTLAPRVVAGLDDDPLRGADALLIEVRRDGAPIPGATTRVALPASGFALDHLMLGADLQLFVEARVGDVVLARGRSFPFDFTSSDAPPASPPDVLLGTLGRFTRTLETAERLVAAAPTREGALVAASDGRVLSYVAHRHADGHAELVARSALPERADARWLAVPAQAGAPIAAGLLAVGGSEPGASLVGADGAVLASLDGTSLPAVEGAATVASSDGAWALVLGGLDAGGQPLDTVTRIDLDAADTRATALASLPAPRAHATATLLTVDDGGTLREVVLLAGGDAAGELTVVDPLDGSARSVGVSPALEDRALVALETGLVVAAGGRAAGATSNEVDLYVVRLDRSPPIERVSPAPPRLFAPRADAVALRLGPGLALIAGGVDDAGAPLAGAELIEVRLDALPGDVVPTGSLPTASRARAAVRLADRSVLVVGDGLASVFVPPRGPE
jgi:hypothetical protein